MWSLTSATPLAAPATTTEGVSAAKELVEDVHGVTLHACSFVRVMIMLSHMQGSCPAAKDAFNANRHPIGLLRYSLQISEAVGSMTSSSSAKHASDTRAHLKL